MTYVTVRTISMIASSMKTNEHLVKYLLHYSLFLKFSHILYINWITWHGECGTIYKNITKLKKINKRCKSVRLGYSF